MTIDAPIDPLERALADVASRIDLTDVDGFVGATMAEVRRARDEPTRRRTFSLIRGPHHRPLLAAAAVIAVIVTAVLAVPQSRDAIADLLGIEGLRIRTEETPTPSPASFATSSSVSPSSTATTTAPGGPTASGAGGFDAPTVGRELALGSQVSLDAARAALPALRELVSPYGPPDAIYLGTRPSGLVSFVWRARPGLAGSVTAPTVGLVVQQYASAADLGFFQKTLGQGTRAIELVVEGKRGYWIDGQPHSIAYIDARNQFVDDTVRWATNALVWAGNGITYRVESSLTQSEVLALVAGLR